MSQEAHCMTEFKTTEELQALLRALLPGTSQ